MRITVYGGVGEVGGNKILLEAGESKIFLDFGESFAAKHRYFEDFLQPRKLNGIGDLLETGLVPWMPGLYRRDLLERAKSQYQYTEPEYDGVFISHAHLDHCAHSSFIDERIPVYCSETTKLYLEAMQESSNADMETEMLRYRKEKETVEKDVRTFRSSDKIETDNLTVNPIHVDHTVVGACGFIVEDKGLRIAYTGDMRLGGPRRDMSEDFIERAAGADILITEGTCLVAEERNREYSFEKGRVQSEEEVEKRCRERIEGYEGIVLADFSSKDIDRLESFLRIAEECGRDLVIGTKEACMLKRLSEGEEPNIPRLSDLKVYMKRKKSGKYDDADYGLWEREYLNGAWTCEDIKKNDVIMLMSLYTINELIDIKPAKGLYIHSRSLPFDDEQDIDFERLQNWINHFHLEQMHAHTSGHMSREQLRSVIERIDPKKVIPVHTGFPEGFEDLCAEKLILPVVGETIDL
jgi:ribonuclease J